MAQWETESRRELGDLMEVLTHYRAGSHTGPMLGLAPPTHAVAPDVVALPGYTRDLFDPGRDDGQFWSTIHPRYVGLRWASELWTDESEPGNATPFNLVGPIAFRRRPDSDVPKSTGCCSSRCPGLGTISSSRPPATATERDGLIEFITEWILPDFAASELWTQLQQADTVYTEKPLRWHIERDDVEFQLDGRADFVLENPDGSWTITETKTTLTIMTNDTRRRYQDQVTCYAWLLATETDVTDPDSITTAIETFGAVTDRLIEETSAASILDRLDDLLEGDGGDEYAGQPRVKPHTRPHGRPDVDPHRYHRRRPTGGHYRRTLEVVLRPRHPLR